MIQNQAVSSYSPTQFREVFVNPERGNDQAEGSQSQPYKTLSYALRQVGSGSVIIRLYAGVYSVESGEAFPIVIPVQTSVLPASQPSEGAVVIRGGGFYDSPTFGAQNITLLMQEGSHLRGVTITNPTAKGTGIWLESVNATIAHCHILHCGREGIFVTDMANPMIVDSVLQGNRASGIAFVRYARGEVRRCQHQNNGLGLVVSDYAAPLVIESQFRENRSGICISGAACPVLRQNQIEKNQGSGLVVAGQAMPDLGSRQDPARNRLHRNGQFDLHNASASTLTIAGNDINPEHIKGSILCLATQVEWTEPPMMFSSGWTGRATLSASQPSFKPSLNASGFLEQTKLMPVLTPLPPHVSLVSAFSNFPDLIAHWAEPFIRYLVTQRKVGGFADGTFNPEKPLSRAEATTWLAQTFRLSTIRPHRGFPDVPANHWAAAAIAQADRTGFVIPFADQTFRPERFLTRLQAILILVQGLRLKGSDPQVLGQYGDRMQIPSFAIRAVAAATQHRLVVRSPQIDRLNWLEPITRAEFAVMLYQGLGVLGQAPTIASPAIVHPAHEIASFTDIADHWAADFVRSLASRGWLKGSADGTFLPDRPMTRAEYAVLLTRIFPAAPERATRELVDLTSDDRVNQAIDRVYRSRLMSGFADGTFRPHQAITRVQVLLSLVNALKLPGAELDLLKRYRDADTIPVAVRPAVATATAQWLVVNYPRLSTLAPNRAATRAEVAAMVHQALVRSGRAAAIPSPYIIHPDYPEQYRNLRSVPIVVLDPGHGGSDPGVAGIGDIYGVALPPPVPAGIERPDMNNPGMERPFNLPDPRMMPPVPPGMPFEYRPGMPPGMPGIPHPGMMPLPPNGMPNAAMGLPPMPPRPEAIPPVPPPKDLPPGMPIVREKDIVLSVAQMTAELLRQQGIRVVLTRSSDQDLDLATRVDIAQRASADVFVSLHANANPAGQPEINGVETYHYPRSAEGADLAHSIHQSMVRNLEINDRQVRSANFYVLRALSIPAALVEIGYMTGKDDIANLVSAEYRRQIAEAIVNGIVCYVREILE